MTLVEPSKVLFVGLGASAVGWYRCYLPAIFMGADWVGLAGDPPKLHFQTGLVKGQTMMADFREYDVVVLQQPRGKGWLKIIRELQEAGKRVYFEVDDYLHGIRKMEDHDFKEHFDKTALAALELNMRVADGIICSTEFIARRYRQFNPNTIVCENGVDTGRYAMTRPPRPTVNIGWAGATGHTKGVMEWLDRVGNVMARNEDTTFVSIGQNFADYFKTAFPNRCISIPWTLIDTYPSAMTMFDIALAPAGRGNFFRGKSDLRWVEAGALGIPTIADPLVYHHIRHGVDGFHASSSEEAEELLELLVQDADLRTRIGENARLVVADQRDMRVAVGAWRDALGVASPA